MLKVCAKRSTGAVIPASYRSFIHPEHAADLDLRESVPVDEPYGSDGTTQLGTFRAGG